ncbi:MAG: Ig-like domain-containing protein, partial [Candidatus Coatesbacteria bacterium]
TTCGPVAGGTAGVVINGTNLSAVTAVTIGGAAATITGNTATTVTVTTPAGTAGAQDVVVTTCGGSAAGVGAFTYTAAPAITALGTTVGPLSGWTPVRITGTNLANAIAVTIGGAAATVTGNTATTVTIMTPSGTAGAWDVVVTTCGGAATETNGFTYDPAANNPPAVSLTGPADGSTFVAQTTVSLTASAYDSNGTISKVEFYAGGVLVGTATTAPYAASWNPGVPGTYVLTAKAYDDVAAVTTSATVSVTVTPAPVAPGPALRRFADPVVAYPNPVAGNVMNVALNLDADAEVVHVVAYNSAMQLSYDGEWRNVTLADGGVQIKGMNAWAPGVYLLRARATLVSGEVQGFPVLKVVVK